MNSQYFEAFKGTSVGFLRQSGVPSALVFQTILQYYGSKKQCKRLLICLHKTQGLFFFLKHLEKSFWIDEDEIDQDYDTFLEGNPVYRQYTKRNHGKFWPPLYLDRQLYTPTCRVGLHIPETVMNSLDTHQFEKSAVASRHLTTLPRGASPFEIALDFLKSEQSNTKLRLIKATEQAKVDILLLTEKFPHLSEFLVIEEFSAASHCAQGKFEKGTFALRDDFIKLAIDSALRFKTVTLRIDFWELESNPIDRRMVESMVELCDQKLKLNFSRCVRAEPQKDLKPVLEILKDTILEHPRITKLSISDLDWQDGISNIPIDELRGHMSEKEIKELEELQAQTQSSAAFLPHDFGALIKDMKRLTAFSLEQESIHSSMKFASYILEALWKRLKSSRKIKSQIRKFKLKNVFLNDVWYGVSKVCLYAPLHCNIVLKDCRLQPQPTINTLFQTRQIRSLFLSLKQPENQQKQPEKLMSKMKGMFSKQKKEEDTLDVLNMFPGRNLVLSELDHATSFSNIESCKILMSLDLVECKFASFDVISEFVQKLSQHCPNLQRLQMIEFKVKKDTGHFIKKIHFPKLKDLFLGSLDMQASSEEVIHLISSHPHLRQLTVFKVNIGEANFHSIECGCHEDLFLKYHQLQQKALEVANPDQFEALNLDYKGQIDQIYRFTGMTFSSLKWLSLTDKARESLLATYRSYVHRVLQMTALRSLELVLVGMASFRVAMDIETSLTLRDNEASIIAMQAFTGPALSYLKNLEVLTIKFINWVSESDLRQVPDAECWLDNKVKPENQLAAIDEPRVTMDLDLSAVYELMRGLPNLKVVRIFNHLSSTQMRDLKEWAAREHVSVKFVI